MGLSNYPVNKNDSHDHTPYWKVPYMRSNKTLKYFYWNFSCLPTGINQFLNVSIYFDLYYNFFSTFMTYNLHRKIKFTIARYFTNICAPGGK